MRMRDVEFASMKTTVRAAGMSLMVANRGRVICSGQLIENLAGIWTADSPAPHRTQNEQ
jgi:hypothetical protein